VDTTIITTCANSIEAHLIKNKLEREGIQSFLINENFSNLMPYFFKILSSGVQVLVNKDDLKRAEEITGLKTDTITCPNCGSENFKIKRKNKLWILFSIFITAPFGNVLNDYSAIIAILNLESDVCLKSGTSSYCSRFLTIKPLLTPQPPPNSKM